MSFCKINLLESLRLIAPFDDNLIKAEQRAREESERLRQQEREQIAEKRKRDLVCIFNGVN